jgi:hypothetical protein
MKHKTDSSNHPSSATPPSQIPMRASVECGVETKGDEEEKKKPSSSRSFRKSRLFWYHIISPPGVSIDCASLGKKKVVVPQTKKGEAREKKGRP